MLKEKALKIKKHLNDAFLTFTTSNKKKKK